MTCCLLLNIQSSMCWSRFIRISWASLARQHLKHFCELFTHQVHVSYSKASLPLILATHV